MARRKLIITECPLCRSGGWLREFNGKDYRCEDCDVKLNLYGPIGNPDIIKECPFCGATKFFYDYFLSIPIFRKRVVCYICETEYLGYRFKSEDTIDKYNRRLEEHIQDSIKYNKWRTYWDNYNDDNNSQQS